jgi:Tfp pilus assembly protein PilE
MTMNTIKTFVAVALFALISSTSYAQTVTASASTLDAAEAKIAHQAKMAGAEYTITQAYAGNQVHMTARLIK